MHTDVPGVEGLQGLAVEADDLSLMAQLRRRVDVLGGRPS